jgi:polyphosphate kinase 2 (PPK2 family)
MFKKTQKNVKWKIIKANKKTGSRVRAMEYILKNIPYHVKNKDIIKHVNIESTE